MKRSTIRFLSALGKLLLVLFCLWLCFHFYQRARGRYHTPRPVGLVQNTRALYLDGDALTAALEQEGYTFLARSEGDNSADLAALLDEGAELVFLALEEGETEQAPALLEQAGRAGATLVFLGAAPEEAVLESYDKAWYLGGSPAYGGEVLGKALADAFRDGQLQDKNTDGLLQYRAYAQDEPDFADSLLSHTLEECEHYGVFSALYAPGSATVEEEESQAGLDEFEKMLLAQQQEQELAAAEQPPELLLAADGANAQAALAEAEEFGWAEQGVSLAGFAASRDEAGQLLEEGVSAAVYYDLDEVTRLAGLMVQNREKGEDLAQDTGYSPDGRFFLVPYQLYE